MLNLEVVSGSLGFFAAISFFIARRWGDADMHA